MLQIISVYTYLFFSKLLPSLELLIAAIIRDPDHSASNDLCKVHMHFGKTIKFILNSERTHIRSTYKCIHVNR